MVSIMLKKTFFVLSCLMLSANILNAQFRWNHSYYSKYNYESFSKSRLAQQKIEFKQIDYSLLQAAIFYETNRQRVINGLSPFKYSPTLEKAAREHSVDMVRRNFFSHTSPVRGKETMSMRLKLVGIKNAYTGENIAILFGLDYESGRPVFTPDRNGGYFSYSLLGKPLEPNTYLNAAKTVVKGWMNSPGHRKNILLKNFEFLGVGAAFFNDRDFYGMPSFKATQNFASVRGE